MNGDQLGHELYIIFITVRPSRRENKDEEN